MTRITDGVDRGLAAVLTVGAKLPALHRCAGRIWGHRLMAYNDIAHIALILREPGRTRGARVSTPVQLKSMRGLGYVGDDP